MSYIILASQSPRRKQLLEAMGLTFQVVPSKFEEQLDSSRDPELVAKELALGKALDVANDYPDAYVIGSDTIVSVDGEQLGKPSSAEEAKKMLKKLAGKPHYVSSAISIVNVRKNLQITDVDTTTVFFGPYNEEAAKDYVATGDPMDKAGGYANPKVRGDTDRKNRR